jgi:hypothetical protein
MVKLHSHWVKDNNVEELTFSTTKTPIDFFRGRRVVIATQHKKEQVIAPFFTNALHALPIVLPDFNTDQFGTFTGEVARAIDPLSTARLKIKEALKISGETLGVASEGSFGPHPNIGFVPADEELILLIDTKNQLEISASKISTHTNYAQQSVTTWEEARRFAIDVGFPTHAIILRTPTTLHKGIADWKILQETFERAQTLTTSIQLETDMRALFNPTRMKVIEETTQLLLDKINSTCPSCHFPGFDIQQRVAGLPCQLCNRPTSFTLKLIYGCQHCSYQSEKLFPDGDSCDPMYCNECNP